MPEPFISRQDMSDALPGNPDLSDNDYAVACVDSACETVRLETGQLFNEVESETILLDGAGTDSIMVPELPATISEVLLDDEAVTDYVLHDSGVLARTDSGVWTLGRGNVEITYDHGYADEDIPRAVRMVALQLALRLFLRPDGVVFESLGARSVRYATDAPGDLTEDERRRLRRAGVYKQPWATVVSS